MTAITTQKIRAVIVEWADGARTEFFKQEDGSWKADGLTTMGPSGMLDHISMWVEHSYREEGR